MSDEDAVTDLVKIESELIADVERLNAALIAERAAKNDAYANVSRIARDFEAFKTQVRVVAIRVADEQNWCDSGLNEVLEELGLPRKQGEYRARVTVTFDLLIKNDTEPDEYDVRNYVENNVDLNSYSTDFDEVEIESTDVYCDSIEEVE